MLATDFRDDAEGARVVAALSDLNVGHVLRSEPESWRGVVWDVARLLGDCVEGTFRFKIAVEGFSDNGGNVGHLI